MGGRPRRQIVITLRAEDWDRLVSLAAREHREPFAQAHRLLLEALEAATLAERVLASPELIDVA